MLHFIININMRTSMNSIYSWIDIINSVVFGQSIIIIVAENLYLYLFHAPVRFKHRKSTTVIPKKKFFFLQIFTHTRRSSQNLKPPPPPPQKQKKQKSIEINFYFRYTAVKYLNFFFFLKSENYLMSTYVSVRHVYTSRYYLSYTSFCGFKTAFGFWI